MGAWLQEAGFAFTPELVRASLVLALVGSAVVVGLLARLGQSAERHFFKLWTISWLFYAVHLGAATTMGALRQDVYSATVPTVAVALSALYMLAGILEMLERPMPRRQLLLAALVLVGVTQVGSVAGRLPLIEAVAFDALALIAVLAGWAYYRHFQWRRNTTAIAAGFAAWAVPVVLTPSLETSYMLAAICHIVSAVVAVAIATGLVVEQEVELSEQKYRSLLDGSPEPVFLVDMWSLKVLDANSAAARLAMLDSAILVGKNFAELCPDLRQASGGMIEHRQQFATVFRPYNEFHFVRSDGGMLLCEGDTNLVQWHQRPVMLVRLRKSGEGQHVGQLVRRAEKMSSLGQLIAGVAHELNNPLAVVMATAQLACKRAIPDEQLRHSLERMLHESERASKIVRDLLSFARPVEPQLLVADLNQIVSQVLDVRQRDLDEANIELEQHLTPALPKTKVDQIQIEQVLNNLITNAIHAMGGRRRGAVLTVATTASSHYIRISVTDNGSGMSKEVLAKIFDPFFTTKAPGKGTGLGLSISHGILQEHHGKIWAESEPGHGATFHLELPIVACDEPAPAAAGAAPAAPSTKRVGRILVVDDEPGIREVLDAILVGAGYEVSCTNNGVEALEQIKKTKFDVIVSDMAMPEMDGEQLYQAIRALDSQLAGRMVFVTGDTVSIKSRTFLEQTGGHWLAKPFNIQDVERVVAAALPPPPPSEVDAQLAYLLK
jgi:two-component system NtrC family sensor kinase